MMIVGFILLAAAAVLAVALIVQNSSTVTVHAFKWSWDVEMRWLIVAGLALSVIGLLGVAMMRIGDSYNQLLRGERSALAAENKRLAKRAGADSRPSAAYEQRHSAQRAP
jgi:uncharacterized integral membrane protein